MDIKQKISLGIAKRLAKTMTKEQFIEALKVEWISYLPEDKDEVDIDKIVDASMQRVKESGMSEVYRVIGIVREDLVKALEEIIKES